MSSNTSIAASIGASSLVPLESRSRRNSSVTGAEVADVDKEQLSQALDKIHSTACQSETLTVFNEFSTPPPSIPNESKRPSGDIVHNGLSGLYSRFRGAVGVGKDTIAPRATEITTGDTAFDRGSNALTATKSHNAPLREESSTTVSSTQPSTPTSQLNSAAASSLVFQSSESQSQGNKSSKTSMVSTPATSKSMILNKSVTTPISKPAPPLAIAPSSAAINASTPQDGARDMTHGYDGSITETSQLGDSGNQEATPKAAATGIGKSVSGDNNASRLGGNSTSTGTLVRQEADVLRNGEDLNKGVSRPSDHDHKSIREPVNIKHRTPSQGGSKNASSALLSVQATDQSRASMRSPVTDTHKRKKPTEKIAQSHLPGYQASRASSTDRSTLENSTIGSVSQSGARPESITIDKVGAGAQVQKRHITNPVATDGNLELVNARLEQMKKQVLSKEFWMADAICKECFLCGDTFSAFRRKHHCRTCGCIFDSKCTSIISGQRFGVQGSLRVCKTCLNIINRRHDSSGSDDTDDDSALPTFFQSQQSKFDQNKAELASKGPHSPNTEANDDPARPLSTPMMAIPATRRIGDSTNRRSAILEIDAPQLSRPSSARSLKALSAAGRPPSSGHKRQQSKHGFFGRFIAAEDERAPFQRGAVDDLGNKSRLPAFHDDNIIDPDLAPYMSDDGSSNDEQMSIFATINTSNVASASFENDRTGFGSLLSANKRHRARVGDKSVSGVSFTSRGLDESNGVSSIAAFSRPPRRRNLSTTNANYHARTPQRHLLQTFAHRDEHPGASEFSSASPASKPSTMTRSVSISGNRAVELNNASLRHVRRLLHQLLQDAKVPDLTSWEKALIPILLQCTDDVDPDVRHGDDIDIRHYVKLKKVPGGKPGDTSNVSGVVFTKNLALKSMPRSILNPRIVIVSFPIEYQRHQHHFMSLEPVIAQEKEFLRNMVNRIASLGPQLLLVQKHVSGLALQYLSEANIAVAYNVKQSVIEAVSRCAQTEIISSIDMVALKPVHVGKSAAFNVKTHVHNDIPGKKKTYIYLSGCPKELGCTIVLRGATMAVLSKMKRITEFMVYVVYNLKLETCLMRDEFVLIPSVADNSGHSSPGRQLTMTSSQTGFSGHTPPRDAILDGGSKLQDVATASKSLSDSTDVLLDERSLKSSGFTNHVSVDDDGHETSLHFDVSEAVEPVPPQKLVSAHESHAHGSHEDQLPEDIPMPTFYSNMVAKHQTKLLSASPFVKFMPPYLLMRARELERRLVYLKRLRDQDTFVEQTEGEKSKAQKFQLIKPEMVHETVKGAPRPIMEVLHAVHDAEYDKALHNYQTQTRQWENYIQGKLDLFDPYAHQNIIVLYTVVCTATTIPCAGPDLLALAFYNEHEVSREFDPDCTLGQYVEDLCLSANTICASNGCEQRMSEHHRTYVHGEARITVFVEKSPCKIVGLQDSILMWSYCKICHKDTQVMPMSESTWKYSLGKYLELSFWSSELRLRAGICPHDLHRDHLRYFGYRNMAIRIHYDPIDLLEIIVPRTRITWKVDNDLRLKNDLFTKIEQKWNRFMASVNSRIEGINIDSVAPEKAEACKAEVEKLLKRSQEERIELIRKLQAKYMESKYYEIIPLNRAVRAMQEKVAQWDDAFADFDANFFPSEKDIRRLAALQLKKMFLDRDESSTSLVSTETTELASDVDEKVLKGGSDVNRNSSRTSPEMSSNTLNSVVEEDQAQREEIIHEKQASDNHSTEHLRPQIVHQDGVEHLDLAITSSPGAPSLAETHFSRGDPPLPSTPFSKEPPSTGHVPNDDVTPAECLDKTQKLSQSTTSETARKLIGDRSNTSGIPRPAERGEPRRSGVATSPPLNRTQSQPNPTVHRLPLQGTSQLRTGDVGTTYEIPPLSTKTSTTSSNDQTKPTDRKLSERLGLSSLKPHRKQGHSLIPRSVHGKSRESKVSTLAKHFDQLSREFEKERMRDRRQRAANFTQSRAFPKASSKPIVEIYKDANEAVEERASEEVPTRQSPVIDREDPNTAAQAEDETKTFVTPDIAQQAPPSTATAAEENTTEAETDDNLNNVSQTATDDDEAASDVEDSILDDVVPDQDTTESLPSDKQSTESSMEIPKHEKSSLMKMLTNFWAERSASGWTPLEYPINASDHIFADEDVIVREDEPSSLIAFTLQSEHYKAKLNDIRSQGRVSKERENLSAQQDKSAPEEGRDDGVDQAEVETSLLRATGTHLAYSFVDSSARMQCKIFFAEQFDAVRRKCGVADRIVESLSRCLKWDSKGGKTKSVFLKTLDDRFILKSLSPVETQAFLKFAPAYFNIMAEVLFHDLPSVIAKMLGFYQIIIKNPVTGTEIKWDVLVMENLFYDRSPTRIFDLKGSMRNRKIQSTGEQNEVLLDENMVEFIYESPLFTREHSKKLLRAAIFNDTLFLQRNDVMDYSLMVAVEEKRKELVVGIIDVVRTYTWDKKLESWIKDRGFAGGGRNRPTVTSPKEYKNRFREAMNRYILQAPNSWHQWQTVQSRTRQEVKDSTTIGEADV